MSVTSLLLDREVYTFSATDRLLSLPSGTARRWVDGYTRRGKVYEPVIRERATGSLAVTWGEFVECRLLSEYRDKSVPLIRMRPVVSVLRDQLGLRYPLAHTRPLVHDQDLVLRAQSEAQLEYSLSLIVVRTGQLLLSDEAQSFVDAVEWSDGEDGHVVQLMPAGRDSPIRIDPERGSGEPVIRNTRTEVLAEFARAGTTVDELAELYDLAVDDVRSVLRFEGVDAA